MVRRGTGVSEGAGGRVDGHSTPEPAWLHWAMCTQKSLVKGPGRGQRAPRNATARSAPGGTHRWVRRCVSAQQSHLYCAHVTRGRAGFGKREAWGLAEEGGSGSTALPLGQAAAGEHMRGTGGRPGQPTRCPAPPGSRAACHSPGSRPGGREMAACNPLDSKGTPRRPPSPKTTTVTQRR